MLQLPTHITKHKDLSCHILMNKVMVIKAIENGSLICKLLPHTNTPKKPPTWKNTKSFGIWFHISCKQHAFKLNEKNLFDTLDPKEIMDKAWMNVIIFDIFATLSCNPLICLHQTSTIKVMKKEVNKLSYWGMP